MITLQRWLVTLTSLGFGLYHPTLGLVMLLQDKYHEPLLVIFSIAIYLAVLVPSIAAYSSLRLPIAQTLANLVAVGTVPLLMQAQLDLDQKGFATWYVAAMATLLTVTAIRQYVWLAWAGLAFLWIEVLVWHGPGFIVSSGLIGALLLVAAGSGLAIGLASTTKAAEELAAQALATARKIAAKSAARSERQGRLKETLRGTLPMLRKIAAQNGNLTVSEKLDAHLLEAELRDEMVGRDLVDALVRDAAREARRRGVAVSIVDDGSLVGASQDLCERIRFKIAEVLNSTSTGKVTVRSPKGEKWLVTVMVSQPGSESAEVFLKLPGDF